MRASNRRAAAWPRRSRAAFVRQAVQRLGSRQADLAMSYDLLHGHIGNGQLRLADTTIQAPGPDGDATLTIRPEHIQLDPTSPLRLHVTTANYAGSHTRLQLHTPGLTLHAHIPTTTTPHPGDLIGITLPPNALWRLANNDPQGEPAGASLQPGAPGCAP